MSPLNSLVLGLGLFFLGLQLVGQNFRQLSGGGFRHLVKSATHTPILAALIGIVAGALMQSATAVTFILVSMVGSGIIQTPSARIVVVWCNVGLTALAFLAAINIHPLVAYIVGFAGILMGSVRVKPWNAVAGAILGVGMILFALGQMGEGAAPLKDAAWFRAGIDFALASPASSFLCGIAAAAILQSNTGAAMLVITLAGVGAIPVERAVPVIYGTNLGAILLRFFLASGMKGAPLRLVRMEDFFCVLSGVLMMTLFFLEAAGIPLVASLARAFGAPDTQLAVVFLLSNLIPALILTPGLEYDAGWLKRIWPGEQPTASLLTSQALSDASTALDLIPRELARLIAGIRADAKPSESTDPESRTSEAFRQQASAVEKFCVRLASDCSLSRSESTTLQRLRAGLHTIRQIGEAVAEFSDAVAALSPEIRPVAGDLTATLHHYLSLAVRATDSLESGAITEFHNATKHHAPAVEVARANFKKSALTFPTHASLSLAALLDNFDIAIWLIHRLAKLETRILGNEPL
jgi:phosphate:Na+ symporter